MTTYEISSIIDEQQYPIECACKLIDEARGYFEDMEDREHLPRYADSIEALLFAATELLRGMPATLDAATDELMAHTRLLRRLA